MWMPLTLRLLPVDTVGVLAGVLGAGAVVVVVGVEGLLCRSCRCNVAFRFHARV